MVTTELPTEVSSIQELAAHYAGVATEGVSEPVLYDLGCGRNPMKGFRGVDLYYSGADVKHDLLNGDWDFAADDTVHMFYSSHFLEHVSDLNGFVSKAWRKLKSGGLFLTITPWGNSPRAWQDPDHKRPIFRETFWYFNKEARERMGVEHYEGSADFDIVNMWPSWNKKYAARVAANPDLAEDYMLKFGAVDDLSVLLRARKAIS